jgi:DNA-binding IclR family transcriptional regulator
MGQLSGIGVIDKAVAILDAAATAPLTLAELVDTTGLPRATAHRLAVALEVHRLLGRDTDGRFTLGTRLGELSQKLPDPLILAAAPVLAWVRDECGESAQLYRREGTLRICVGVAERAAGLRTTVPIGAQLPLSAGSGAQVLCSELSPAEQVTLAAVLTDAQFTQRTLAEVRRRGWAQSIAEREPGVASVSAPVRNQAGDIVAALSISGPVERMGRNPGSRHANNLITGAQRITDALSA